MFTKEKLEKWIEELDNVICKLYLSLKTGVEGTSVYNRILSRMNNLEELKTTLEQLHTSITSDGSI
jgi:pentose-5-phosphate-3-epimerase